jgi:hypothetical protein
VRNAIPLTAAWRVLANTLLWITVASVALSKTVYFVLTITNAISAQVEDNCWITRALLAVFQIAYVAVP